MQMDVLGFAGEIISGRRIKRGEDVSWMADCDISSFCEAADLIRQRLCGDKAELCTIVNGRSGKCSENCRFCAQSSHYDTGAEVYKLLAEEEIYNDCKGYDEKGINRYSIVTAGRDVKGADLDMLCRIYKRLSSEFSIKLCGSHGLLKYEDYVRLKESGVTRCHENIETSRRYFPEVCTTHTYEDKMEAIDAAKRAGLEICSGGIIGMGEKWEDRVDMAVSLSETGVVSIPINVLIPIKGTPFEKFEQLKEEEILRTIAMFRFINPSVFIRLAGGRAGFGDEGRKALKSGANAVITGDMLTTSGCRTETDKKMFDELNYKY